MNVPNMVPSLAYLRRIDLETVARAQRQILILTEYTFSFQDDVWKDSFSAKIRKCIFVNFE